MKKIVETNSIGNIQFEKGLFSLKLHTEYKEGLINIDGFSHLQILWWGNQSEGDEHRSRIVISKPYKKGPDKLGVFATRSQFRPNPILLTTILVHKIDFKKGIIYTPYIDAENESPILDIKPFHRYENLSHCQVPGWCSHWPSCYEDSANFDWEAEFNF